MEVKLSSETTAIILVALAGGQRIVYDSWILIGKLGGEMLLFGLILFGVGVVALIALVAINAYIAITMSND